MSATEPPVFPPGYLEANRWNEFYIPTCITFALSMTAVTLRFVAALVGKKRLWWDDLAAGIAGACGLAIFIVLSTIWKDVGYGKHIVVPISTIGPQILPKLLKSFLVLELLYATAITTSKLSILAFLWRIFSPTTMRHWLMGIILIAICWQITVVFLFIFACVPVHAFWDLTVTDKKCLDLYKMYLGITFPNMLTDFAITLLPIPYVWMLHISTKQKIMVAVTLFMGGATCVVSTVRLANILQSFSLADPTWDTVTLMKWTAVEVYCAITAICLPTLRPLVRLITGHSPSTTTAASRPSKPSTGSSGYFSSGKRSARYRSADADTEFETGSEMELGIMTPTQDGFTERSFPVNAINVRSEYEVR